MWYSETTKIKGIFCFSLNLLDLIGLFIPPFETNITRNDGMKKKKREEKNDNDNDLSLTHSLCLFTIIFQGVKKNGKHIVILT